MAIGITTPSAGATLRGSIQVFTWDLEGLSIESSFLYIGSSRGRTQYGSRYTGNTSQPSFGETSFGGLPTDGSTVFVRLWYKTDGIWRFFDEQYTAATSANLPTIIEPAPGQPLTGATQTFSWSFDDLAVVDSWLYVGATIGGSDYAAMPTGTETSALVSGLPTDQSTVNLRLYFKAAGIWYNIDAAFDAATVIPPTRDELTRELQRLAGTTPDGIVGPQTRAALNRNWLGRPESFDLSFSLRFVNDEDLVRWVQRRINTRSRGQLEIDGNFDETTEAAVVSHLQRAGIVAAESYLTLLDP
ncbi:MAG: peptidoglycan-binding domain-containing protein [Acidimicrobiales bacterium]